MDGYLPMRIVGRGNVGEKVAAQIDLNTGNKNLKGKKIGMTAAWAEL